MLDCASQGGSHQHERHANRCTNAVGADHTSEKAPHSSGRCLWQPWLADGDFAFVIVADKQDIVAPVRTLEHKLTLKQAHTVDIVSVLARFAQCAAVDCPLGG